MEQPTETTFYDYGSLPTVPPLTPEYVAILDTLIKGNWVNSFQCLTALRSIIKQFPEFAPDIVAKYSQPICELINNGKTQIIKNSLAFITQVFSLGRMVNVQNAVMLFVGLLLKKAAVEHGMMKEQAEQALQQFSSNCGYDSSFILLTNNCTDKNSGVAELAIKHLAKMIEAVGAQIAQLKPQTLQNLMKCLTMLVDHKRQNVRNWGVQICMHIYGQIGAQNYMQLMSYCLTQQEMQVMMAAMDTKKASKFKDVKPLNQVLKERKSMMPQMYQMANNQENQPPCMYNQ